MLIFRELSLHATGVLSQFPPILDDYLVKLLQDVGYYPDDIEEDYVVDDLGHTVSYIGTTNAIVRLINVLCNEYGDQTAQKVEAMDEWMDYLLDTMGIKQDGLQTGLFKDNILIMICAMLELSKRPTRADLRRRQWVVRNLYKMELEVENSLIARIKSFLVLLSSARDSKRGGSIPLIQSAYAKRLAYTPFSRWEELTGLLEELLETLEISGHENHGYYCYEMEALDHELHVCGTKTGKFDKNEVKIVYGTIHWLVRVFGIPIATACNAVAEFRDIIGLEKKDPTDPTFDVTPDVVEGLRTQYHRYLKKGKVTSLSLQGSKIYK